MTDQTIVQKEQSRLFPRTFPVSAARAVEILLVVLLVGLGFGLRMLNLTTPPIDFHPTRQLRSAIIARGMYYSTLKNADPEQRAVALLTWSSMERYEPPILETIVADTYRLIGGEHVWVARIYSSLFWIIGGLALYALARRATSPGAALFSLGFYLVLPWGVLASRSFQPDPWMVMWVLLAAYALYRWVEGGLSSWLWTVLAGLFSGLAMLIKAYAFYPIAGMALFLLLSLVFDPPASDRRPLFKNLLHLVTRPQLWVAAVLAGILPGIYYIGLGSRSSGFLSFWVLSFAGLLTDHKFYIRWLGLIRGLMDVMIFFAAMLGALLFRGRARALALGLWLGYLLTGLTFPFQIYTHDYYSIILVPIVALSLVPLVEAVLVALRSHSAVWKTVFLVAAFAVLGYYAWVARSQVAVTASYNNEPYPWQQMGKDLPRDGDIIALTHDYGNRLKYYGWRMVKQLWPAQGDLDLSEAQGVNKVSGDFETYFKAQTKGMSYFLVTLFGDLDAQPQLKAMLYDHYPIYKQGDGYVLFDLRHPRQ